MRVVGPPFHLGQQLQVLRGHRLLDEGGMVGPEPLDDLQRHVERQPSVHLDHQLDPSPTARRTAATMAIARSISSALSRFQAVPNGSNFIPR